LFSLPKAEQHLNEKINLGLGLYRIGRFGVEDKDLDSDSVLSEQQPPIPFHSIPFHSIPFHSIPFHYGDLVLPVFELAH
jgi:hypothetical protein